MTDTSGAADITLGVSLYSYGGDYLVTMTLEDCLADVADMGAADVEILADTHIQGYPAPSSAWVDRWHELVDGFRLTPTCYSCWLDTRLRKDRGLTVDEAVAILGRDLELAHRLGFSIVRPKLGVVSLDLIPDPVWRETVLRSLPKAEEYGLRIAPEIHAPTPLRSKIVDDYLELVRETGTEHFGLLIDTGIFQIAERPQTHSDAKMIFGSPEPEVQGARAARDVEADGRRSGRPRRPAALRLPRPREVLGHDRRADRSARPLRRGRRGARGRRLHGLALERVRGAARPVPRVRHAAAPAGDAPPAAP